MTAEPDAGSPPTASGPTVFRGVRVPGFGPLADVRIAAGRIADVAATSTASEAASPRASGDSEVVEGDGRWLLPGLIDLQVNDIEWLATGFRDPTDHVARIGAVAKHQAERGVTGFVLATLAAPLEEVLAYLVGMSRFLDGAREGTPDAAFVGGLVEGTFMNPEFHGAHNPKWVFPPDEGIIERLIATEAMRLLNIAPETSDDALDRIRQATGAGIVVGCGHAKPHAERLRAAVAAGLRYIIHLGNGPTGSSLKRFHDGGMLEESLRNDDLVATVILDGYHVHPEIVRDWISRKGVERVVAVSDAGFAMGPPREDFEVFGIRGGVAEGERYLYVRRPDDAPAANPHASDAFPLFGAAVDQLRVFENAIGLMSREMAGVWVRRHEALPLEDAVAAACAMCAAGPARLLGRADRGVIEPGARADVLLARIEGNPGACEVTLDDVRIAGRSVLSRA